MVSKSGKTVKLIKSICLYMGKIAQGHMPVLCMILKHQFVFIVYYKHVYIG